MNASIKANIDLFFEDPRTPHPSGSTRKWGVLHLLRRDIIKCFANSCEFGEPALWPGAMTILAGVDLLGKFWKGDDSADRGQVGKRFRGFVREYFHLSRSDTDGIYQLRNSLFHSFGLYSKTRTGNYRFVLSQTLRRLMCLQGNDIYKVDVLFLRGKLEDAIAEYHEELMNDKTLQANFEKMFWDYGSIDIG